MHLSCLRSSHRKPLPKINNEKPTRSQLAAFPIHLISTTLARLTAIHGRALLKNKPQGAQPPQLRQLQNKRPQVLLEGAGNPRISATVIFLYFFDVF